MNYEDAERAIVDRLNNHFQTIGKSNVFVAALMPETEADAKEYESLFPKSCVAVQYLDSSYQRPDSLRIVKQNEAVTFRVLFECRKLRGESGFYLMKDEVKLSLIGFRMANADQLFISGFGKQQFENGAWVPYLDFECKTMNVQIIEESESIGGNFTGLELEPKVFTNEFQTGVFQ